MNVLTSSWRNSLAAATLTALIGLAPADAQADDPPPKEPGAVTADQDAIESRRADPTKDADRVRLPETRRREMERAGPNTGKVPWWKAPEDREGMEATRRDEADERVHEKMLQRQRMLERREQELARMLREENVPREKIEAMERELAAVRAAAERMEREARSFNPPGREVGREEAEFPRAHEIGSEYSLDPEHVTMGPEGLERRMHHLRVAVDNLRAAGLHEQAEQLMHDGEFLVREGFERDRPRLEFQPRGPFRERPERPDAAMDPFSREDPASLQRTDQAVIELRGQTEELRREVNELRELLKEVLNREHDSPFR
jgi:hypothetical protein